MVGGKSLDLQNAAYRLKDVVQDATILVGLLNTDPHAFAAVFSEDADRKSTFLTTLGRLRDRLA